MRRVEGQSTAEHLLMLTLAVIGCVGLWTALGKTIQAKLFYVAAALVGDPKNYEDSKAATRAWSITAGEKAKRKGDVKVEGIEADDLKSN